jgi:hypothetical protein
MVLDGCTSRSNGRLLREPLGLSQGCRSNGLSVRQLWVCVRGEGGGWLSGPFPWRPHDAFVRFCSIEVLLLRSSVQLGRYCVARCRSLTHKKRMARYFCRSGSTSVHQRKRPSPVEKTSRVRGDNWWHDLPYHTKMYQVYKENLCSGCTYSFKIVV